MRLVSPKSGTVLYRRKQLDAVASGRDAEAAYRVQGRVVSKEEFKEAQNSRQPKKQPKYIEEEVSWKRGLVQRKAAESQHQAQEEEVRPTLHSIIIALTPPVSTLHPQSLEPVLVVAPPVAWNACICTVCGISELRTGHHDIADHDSGFTEHVSAGAQKVSARV